MADNLFDIINSLSNDKIHRLKNTENDELAEKGYEPFMVNRAFSLYSDTILYANEMNMHSSILDKRLQYDFYFEGLRKKKRFSKWPKKVKTEDLDLIKNHYGYNTDKALKALEILSTADINKIREKTEKGGRA